MKKKFAVLLTLAFILTSCARPAQRPLETNHSSMFGMAEVEYCRVTADRAEVKDGLGDNFDTITTLNRNQIVRVLRAVGDRYVVQLNNNEVGTVDTADVTPIVKEDGDEGPQQPTPGQQPNAIQRPEAGQEPGNIQRPEGEQQPDAAQRPGAPQQPNVTQQPDAAQRPAEVLPLNQQKEEMIQLKELKVLAQH